MVFAALKLKFHRGIALRCAAESRTSLVITDRKDLHEQISKTFAACGLPSPQDARERIRRLRRAAGARRGGADGDEYTIFQVPVGRAQALKSADRAVRKGAPLVPPWSCRSATGLDHDGGRSPPHPGEGLGRVYAGRACPTLCALALPGTPVRRATRTPSATLAWRAKSYLDKYGILDAVADVEPTTCAVYLRGAALTEWHLEGAELDILFDQYFANEPEERGGGDPSGGAMTQRRPGPFSPSDAR